jgi:hypothetical protein
MTRDQLRNRIDIEERLFDVMSAIDDLSATEFAPHERELVALQITDRDLSKLPIAAASALPRDIVLVGLQAMQKELEKQLAGVAEVAA